MEEKINKITERRWAEIESGEPLKNTLKLAILEGYQAGMEAAREVFTS